MLEYRTSGKNFNPRRVWNYGESITATAVGTVGKKQETDHVTLNDEIARDICGNDALWVTASDRRAECQQMHDGRRDEAVCRGGV